MKHVSAVIVTAVLTGGCAKTPEWEQFFQACQSQTQGGGEFFYRKNGGSKPLDWTQSPYKYDLIRMCHAKANLFVEGFHVSPAITVPEYRLYIATRLTDRNFDRELRRSLRRD
jgi:hypothetical protein